ncbi:Zn(II)2Cys6 transcription factor [Aspergillus campestris IBT 28561]|uniref:Zn(II)2Cys6 transcription factor n=1 Tax=Aspergillus campestris (strain IBT 28561) TaxID=1392248 RepID=A0A2I1D522_ASPC2|nr:Zn(II)2Cys6 transcription factor [Aspergillus campestris IBT 28561]PKY04966.1 Zn(II)2Cys6 transcription factor [Aspergillus campestris IBT 28561]
MADSPHRTRSRARQACLHCNRRRIKCNVLSQRPCHNCISQNVPCELGVSKRGKYPRKKPPPPITPRSEPDTPLADATQLARGEGPLPQRIPMAPRSPWITPESASSAQPTVFLGESSPLTCVIDEGRRSSPDKGSALKTRLHYAIPERLDSTSARDDVMRAHKAQMEIQLSSAGAFSYPPLETRETLLKAYFDWFHPCFPILDRAAVQQLYSQGTISPLLLQSMLFIGVSLCTDDEFARTDFAIRYHAKFLFYSRAKALYDADWETNKTVKLQSIFMLSFWRGGPSEERDTWSWLGVAISLAQKRGMHMMSKFSFHSPREAKLWKRIWWALYIRDQQSAAALGLPPRIRDEDCAVAMLQPDDVLDDEVSGEQHIFGTQCATEVPYPVEMAKLARILHNIVSSQYLPVHSTRVTSSRAALCQQLCEWEAQIPEELKLDRGTTPKDTFLAGLLHMTYNNLYILLYRSSFLYPPNEGLEQPGQAALDAATRSTRIIEDMLSHNLVQHGPTHLITHAFSTLCIHTIHCRRASGTTRKLAEHRARLCLLGLQELQKSWDLENWVLDLFFRCLDDCTARNLRLPDHTHPATEARHSVSNETPETHTPHYSDDITTSHSTDATLDVSLQAASAAQADLSAPSEWFGGLFNFTDDYTDVLGTAPSQEPSNLQNLEFLYRFL